MSAGGDIAVTVGTTRAELDSLAAERRAKALQIYLNALNIFSEDLPYTVLPGESVPTLTQIYIEQFADAQPVQSQDNKQPIQSQDNREPNENSRAERRTETVDEALKRFPHLLVEGGPGMGKSSLISSLTLKGIKAGEQSGGVQMFPVPVFARGIATTKGSWSSRLYKQVSAQLGLRLQNDLPSDFFEYPPQQGVWLVLLDGLDEIIDPEARQELIQAILHYVQVENSPYRFLITTRPNPFSDQLKGPSIGHYVLRPFDSAQVKTFVKRWFAHRPGASADDSERFLGLVDESRIGDLSHVPLLLTMAVIVYEADHERGLPTRRASLYEKFVGILLNSEVNKQTHQQFQEEWEAHYPGAGKRWIDDLFGKRRLILERIACWQQEGGTGSIGGEAARYVLSEKWLPPSVHDDWLEEQLHLLSLRSGLIVLRGEEASFLHPTFREFLTASALARTYPPDDQKAVALIDRWSVRGREVLLFLLGIWNARSHGIDKLIRYILKRDKDGDLLAGLVLADGVSVDESLDGMIVEALLNRAGSMSILDILRHASSSREGQGLSGPLEILGALRHRSQVTKGLVALALNTSVQRHVRNDAARALGSLGKGDELRALAQDAKLNSEVRSHAAKALGQLGLVDEAWPVLVALATNHEVMSSNPLAADHAAEALITIGRSDVALPVLIYNARDAQYHYQYRTFCARKVWQLGRTEDARILLLRQSSEPETSGDAQIEIAQRLSEGGLSSESERLLGAVVKDVTQGAHSRVTAAEELAKSSGRARAIALLKEMATDLSIEADRMDLVFRALRELGEDLNIKDTLYEHATNRALSGGIRLRSATSLALFRYKEEAVSILQELANDQANKLWVRKDAEKQLFLIKRYGYMFSRGSGIIFSRMKHLRPFLLRLPVALLGTLRRFTHLLALASHHKVEQKTRRAAVESLIAFQRGDELLALVSDPSVDWGQVENLRPLAVESLAKFCATTDLIDLAADASVDEMGRLIAILALDKAGRMDVLPPLLLTIARDRALEDWVRKIACESLAELKSFDALLAISSDESLDTFIRTKSAEVLVQHGMLDDTLTLANSADTNAWTRIGIAQILAGSNRSDLARSILILIVHDTSTDVWARMGAVSAMRQYDCVADLVEFASSSSIPTEVRKEAIWCLGEMPAHAHEVLPVLQSLISEGINNDVNKSVFDAIKYINLKM